MISIQQGHLQLTRIEWPRRFHLGHAAIWSLCWAMASSFASHSGGGLIGFISFDEFWLFRDESGELDGSRRSFGVGEPRDEALGLFHLGDEVAAFMGLVVAGEGQGHGVMGSWGWLFFAFPPSWARKSVAEADFGFVGEFHFGGFWPEFL